MASRRRALLAAASVAGAAAQILGFNYTSCAPTGKDVALAIGDTAYVCVDFNGHTRGAFNVAVDAYSAIQLSSCALARGGMALGLCTC